MNKEMEINCRSSTSHAPDAILHRYVTAEWSFACSYLWGGEREIEMESPGTQADLELLS